MHQRSGVDRARSSLLIGLVAGEADPRAAELIRHHLADPSADVRLGAANAAGLLAWPELVPALESAVADRDPAVADMVGRALSLSRSAG